MGDIARPEGFEFESVSLSASPSCLPTAAAQMNGFCDLTVSDIYGTEPERQCNDALARALGLDISQGCLANDCFVEFHFA